MESIKELEMAFCEVCGNVVPTVEFEGDLYCAYEYEVYPDIATIVGQENTMTELELEELWDEMIDEGQDLIKIGDLSYLPSQVLKAVDPIAYRIGKYDFADLYMEDREDD